MADTLKYEPSAPVERTPNDDDEPSDSAASIKYAVLDQRSPDYDAETWCELQDLYKGGYTIARAAGKYLPQISGESAPRYENRIKAGAAYINFLGEIVDYFGSALFTQEITVTEASDADNKETPGEQAEENFYTEFGRDCDLKGTSFSKLMHQVFPTAALKRKALVAIDFPPKPKDSKIETRKDEDRKGLSRAYAYEIPVEQMIDWEYDDSDVSVVDVGANTQVRVYAYAWCILKRTIERRRSPRDTRGICVDEFKVWEKDATTGLVSWCLYRTREYTKASPIRADEDVPLVSEGTTSFKCIPLVELCLPEGLWIGNKIGTLAKEHYQRRSALVAAENKSLVPIPTVFLGTEIGAPGGELPSEVQQDPNRASVDPRKEYERKGLFCLGKGDEFKYVAPDAEPYEVVNTQLKELKDDMYRVVHHMAASVDNSASSTRRSGDSKRQDRAAEVIVLGAFGKLMRDFARRVFAVISTARGEDVVWTAHGLEDFQIDDREAVLAEAVQVDAITIPSQTFVRAYKTKLAFQLLGPGIEPATKETIKDEIEKGVEAEASMRAMLSAASTQDQGADPNVDPATPPDPSKPTPPRLPPAGGQAAPAASAASPSAAPASGKAGVASPASASVSKLARKTAPTVKSAPDAAPPVTSTPTLPSATNLRGPSKAGVAETVYQQLLEDFPPKAIAWVRAAHWEGPTLVPLDQLDFQNRAEWKATNDPEHVDDFVKTIDAGQDLKPVILVNEPNDNKLIIVDGHHRVLACEKRGIPVRAFVAFVGAVNGPWDEMHASQRGGSSPSM